MHKHMILGKYRAQSLLAFTGTRNISKSNKIIREQDPCICDPEISQTNYRTIDKR